jgi:acyl dehydratase
MGYDGIIASGLQTICLSNALVAEIVYADIAITAGPGIENVDHARPVRPGDTLSIRAEVTRRRLLESRPGEGLVGIEQQVSNQNGKQTTSMIGLLFIQAQDGPT